MKVQSERNRKQSPIIKGLEGGTAGEWNGALERRKKNEIKSLHIKSLPQPHTLCPHRECLTS